MYKINFNMKKYFFITVIIFLTVKVFCQMSVDYPIETVPFNMVKITDRFWSQRMEVNRTVTIPMAFKKCEETGRIDNFAIAAGLKKGKFQTLFPFDDSDVYKIIEGASYSLSNYYDLKLDQYVDSLIALIGKAQEPDGYLYTNRTIDPQHTHPWAGKERWVNEWDNSHELYNAGHFYEAAVAHFQATGKRTMLNIAIKNADLFASVFGPGKKHVAPGHEVIEMGLVKLYRATGDKKYLDLAKFFIDCRGERQHDKNSTNMFENGKYWQDDKPLVNQEEAAGHAVRAGYIYSGVADVAALTGNKEYLNAIDKIWNNAVYKKLYITGGIGSRHEGEAFGDNYELPNLTAYNETCASIANVYWNYRMFLLHGESKYIDVLEAALYNGVISGISLSGSTFFYPNPLESNGKFKFNNGVCTRKEWFDCSCCPSNLARFLPSIPGFIYAKRKDTIYVNLFVNSRAEIKMENNNSVIISQETNYPWDGITKLKIQTKGKNNITCAIRIPCWASNQPLPGDLYHFADQNTTNILIKINNKQIERFPVKQGFALINREWKSEDELIIEFPMQVRTVAANSLLKEDKQKLCLKRGPLVYCAEGVDNKGKALNIIIPENGQYSVAFQNDLLNGIDVVKGDVFSFQKDSIHNKVNKLNHTLTAIPYYAWCHRQQGEMEVWFYSDKYVFAPEVKPHSTYFLDKQELKLIPYIGNDVHYTIDGSKPNITSPLYVQPITFDKNITLKAASFDKQGNASDVVTEQYTKTEYHQPVTVSGLTNGLQYKYYEGVWQFIPDFNVLSPLKTGECKSFDISIKSIGDHFGFVFNGYINIQKDGIYTFFLNSDDGSRLIIDDEQVILNDGCHGVIEKSGQIALRKGFHKISVDYFDSIFDDALEVYYESPDIKKQQIPATALFYFLK